MAAGWTASTGSPRAAAATASPKRCAPTVECHRPKPQPYFYMAEQYAFGDRMFQTNSGPSFPAHQYLISGTSTIKPGSGLRAAENPLTPRQTFSGGCDSPPGTLAMLIDRNGTEDQQVYPCFDRPALTDRLEAKSLSWRYYQAHPGPGLWNAPDAIPPIFATARITRNRRRLAAIANTAGHQGQTA